MFCTIQDAWGSDFNDGKSTDSEKSDKSDEFHKREYKMPSSDSESKDYVQYMKLKERFNTGDDKVCVAVNTHINQCPACKSRYLKKQESFILPTVNDIMNKLRENADAMTLILICVLILLIVKLFASNN